MAETVGHKRLERFGDMNLIDDFVSLFPAYKHDDVFLLEYLFVIDRLHRNQIIRNIDEQIRHRESEKARKEGF